VINTREDAYRAIIESKAASTHESGFDVDLAATPLYEWQQRIGEWATRKGRSAIFADCGLGKTPMQLVWADEVSRRENKPVLILAPLAVSEQTVREGKKFNIEVDHRRNEASNVPIQITNYERLHHFDPADFTGIVLDESSILKNYSGSTRQMIIDWSSGLQYRLACTATPAPNDYMEIGNHSEFLGVMRRVEMLSRFFVHDGGDTALWRLKKHAQSVFWKWMATWCVALRTPSDIGFDDDRFNLPPMFTQEHIVENTHHTGYLFTVGGQTLQERRAARRGSLNERVGLAAELANASDKPFLCWCNLNAESKALKNAIPDAVEVCGADSEEHKIDAMLGFSEGRYRVLVTKPSICGFGMNWQHCAEMAFVGLSDSYEQYYQALRRCWRHGQQNPVTAHIIISEAEGAVRANVQRKERQASEMFDELVKHVTIYDMGKRITNTLIAGNTRMEVPAWLK